MSKIPFPEDFIFGVAAASYQIEGARRADGKTDSIWDTFCDIKGNIARGESGENACRHYEKFPDDIKLMKELGISHYRLSVSWPRIFPRPGGYNPAGMDFYQRLTKELDKNGIKYFVTLNHWDIPQWFQGAGGWEKRENTAHFVQYADKCFECFSNAAGFITHNEPWCVAFVGNWFGGHAPGKRDLGTALKVGHNLLLSHGQAVGLFREKYNYCPIGIALNLVPVYARTNSPQDLKARDNYSGYFNRWFLDPVFNKKYPEDILGIYKENNIDLSFIHDGDFQIISGKMDFLGVNYYHRRLVEYDEKSIFKQKSAPSDYKKTDMGWDISPAEFGDLINMIRKDYTNLPVYITENGSCFTDKLVSGKIIDTGRAEYLRAHLKTVAELNKKGAGIRGYFAWSVMDNFEWAEGYEKRFGLVYVNFETQERIPKESYYVYKSIISAREI